jgi:uncharacterized membrane protein YgcG
MMRFSQGAKRLEAILRATAALPRRKRKRQPPQQRGKKRGGKRARRTGAESRRWAVTLFAAFCLTLCVAGFETTRGVVAALIVLSCGVRFVLQCRTRGWEDEEWDPYPDEHNLNIKRSRGRSGKKKRRGSWKKGQGCGGGGGGSGGGGGRGGRRRRGRSR